MKYNLKKIIDKVYCVSFKEHYDLCMFFLRYQEYYESPNSAFRRKQFQIIDFMEWYSKDREGFFSYPLDWGGFNIPSFIIDEVHNLGIYDKNKYDYEMLLLHRKLKEEVGGDYYLIGAPADCQQLLKHEVAHGLYYTVPEYKLEMDKLVKKLPVQTRKHIYSWLKDIGYTKEVFVDEAQAYLSTGFTSSFKRCGWKRVSKPFIKVYTEFMNEKTLNPSKG